MIYGRDGYPYIIWLKHKYINETEYDGNLYYKQVDQTRALSNPIIIKRGDVYDPLAFQSYSSTARAADGDVNFAVGWKSGNNSNELHLSEIPIGYRFAGDSESDDIIYSSDKKLSDVYWCFVPEGIIAAVTERDNLSDEGKHSDLSFIYTNIIYNSPPYVPTNPSPDNGLTGVDINANLIWTGGDPDGDNITYDVYFDTGIPPLNVLNNHSSNSYDPGTMSPNTKYFWKIVAHDDHNHTTEGPIWNFTTTGNQPPIANVGGPYSGYVDEQITFDGSGSTDPDGSITGYRWDFTNDGTYDTDWLTSPTTAHTYSNIGTFTVKLQIRDNNGAEDTDTTTVEITEESTPPPPPPGDDDDDGDDTSPPPPPSNSEPIAEADGPYYGFIGEEIEFDGTQSSDSDGNITEWYWEFGDGTNGAGETVTHID